MKCNFGVRLLVFTILMVALSAAAFGQVFLSVRIGPPALPIYAQPICPGPGYLWTPGYWGWNDDGGYYWVPGTWLVAPIGMLWTPGYWGWGGGLYAWHAGYWGPHIGFYGGINYGFGYGGVGFVGGEWRGGAFFYNRAVMNVDSVHITNVYNRTVVVNENHVAFNGGEGGIAARPTAQEEAAAREPHQAPLAAQTEHEHTASQNRAMFASENHGRPAVAATSRPGEFSGHGVVAAREAGAAYHAPAMSPREARGPSTPGDSRSEGSRNSEPSSNEQRSNESRSNDQRSPQPSPPSNVRTAETHTDTGRAQEESHPAKAPKASKPAKRNKHENAPKEERNKER